MIYLKSDRFPTAALLVLQMDAPYIRFRNGKKELVKGYVRMNREL